MSIRSIVLFLERLQLIISPLKLHVSKVDRRIAVDSWGT
jgi:hypothetical protein